MRLAKRIAVVAASGLFMLAAAAVVVFALGKPTTTQAPLETVVPAQVSSEATALADGETDPRTAPVDSSDRLAIEIPGCVCHSDDPQLVVDHATRRMSECIECHQGGTPGMG
jgi:hypothetical protein